MALTGKLQHWEYQPTNSALPLVGATVQLRAASLAHPNVSAILASTTTDANGMWAFNALDESAQYDVRVTASGVEYWYKGLSYSGSFLKAIVINDSALTVQDEVDNTKKAQFSAGGITAGATRVLTLPDQDDDLVGRTIAQTLTNKTLTTPVIGDLTNAQHGHAAAASGGQVDHTALTSKGTNTHATLDTHLSSAAAVHGLGAGVSVLGDRNAAGEFVQRGTSTVVVGAGVKTGTLTVNFPVLFGGAPKVVATCTGITGVIAPATEGPLMVAVESIAVGSMVLYVILAGNAAAQRSIPVDWIALGA